MLVDRYRLEKGLKTHCGCRRKYNLQKEKDFPHEYIGKSKTCTSCGEEHPYTDYYFKETVDINGIKQYLFNAMCIDCYIKRGSKYTKEHPEMNRESSRKTDKTPKMQAYHKEAIKNLREEGYFLGYYADNPEKYIKYREDHDAHKKHTISIKDWNDCKEFFGYKCAYCGITETEHKERYGQQLQKDHAENQGDNGIGNCVPACRSCNSVKKKNDWDNWFTPENSRYSQDKYNIISKWLNSFNNTISN